MSKDLEDQLNEMGPEFRTVVDRLKDAYAPLGTSRPAERVRPAHVMKWTIGYLVAASLLVVIGLGIVLRPSETKTRVYTVRATDARTEYTLAFIRNDDAVKEMIRTQQPDGGWTTDFLTRQNAEALKRSNLPAAQIAYKKAMRNLRVKGVL